MICRVCFTMVFCVFCHLAAMYLQFSIMCLTRPVTRSSHFVFSATFTLLMSPGCVICRIVTSLLSPCCVIVCCMSRCYITPVTRSYQGVSSVMLSHHSCHQVMSGCVFGHVVTSFLSPGCVVGRIVTLLLSSSHVRVSCQLRCHQVMDKLLDKDVSTQYKAPSLAAYISACSDTFNAVHVASNYPCLPPSAHHQSLGTLTNTPPPPSCPTSLRATSGAVEVGSSAPLGVTVSASSLSAPCPVDVACSTASTACDSMSYERHAGDVTSSSPTHSSLHDGVGHTGISSSGAAEVGGSCGTRPKVSYALRYYRWCACFLTLCSCCV